MIVLTSATRRAARAAPAAAVLLLGVSAASAAPVVWDASAGGNGNTYDVVFDDAIDWNAARSAAQARGGDLVTVQSQAEQDFVESVLTGNNAQTGSYWMGLIETTEGVYQHVDGTGLGFINWVPGQPDNSQGAETVGAMLWAADETAGVPTEQSILARRGGWNDAPVQGYPTDGLVNPPVDAWRGGYLVEIAAANGGDGDGDGGGTVIPLPAAVYAFPMTAGLAGLFYRRMRRNG